MTPTFNPVGDNPLSVLTLAGLEDIGYSVDYSAADSYGAADMDGSCVCRRRHTRLLMRAPMSGRLRESDVGRAQEFGKRILARHRTLQADESLISNTIAVLFQGSDGTIGSVIVV